MILNNKILVKSINLNKEASHEQLIEKNENNNNILKNYKKTARNTGCLMSINICVVSPHNNYFLSIFVSSFINVSASLKSLYTDANLTYATWSRS